MQIVVMPAFVEREQGWVFESEHGKGRHQDIGQRDNALPSSGIGDPGKARMDQADQGIGRKMLPCGQAGHGQLLGPKDSAAARFPEGYVYETPLHLSSSWRRFRGR